MESTITEYNCELCGQHGNSPHWYNGRAYCKFDADRMRDKDKAVEQRRNHKEFKKLMSRFQKERDNV